MTAKRRIFQQIKKVGIKFVGVEFIRSISTGIGYSAMIVGGFLVISTISNSSVGNYATIVLSYLAIIAGLAALCYSASNSYNNPDHKSQLRIGGERLFHAVLLIVQSIFLRMLLDREDQFLKNYPAFYSILNSVIGVCCTVLTLYSLYQVLFGFRSINNFLWERHLERNSEKGIVQK